MSAALEVRDLGIAFGGVVAVDGVSFDAPTGEILSIIGPNGAGKTTLFNMVSGLYTPRSGSVRMGGEDVSGLPPFRLARKGMSRTFQNLQVFAQQTALDNVMVGRARWESTTLLEDLLRLPSVGRQNRQSRERAMAALERTGLAAHANAVAGSLSYGVLKRLEIARALASEPKVLLLDEPAAGCNAVETEEIEHMLRGIAGEVSVVLIEHDMKMVMRLSHQVLVLNQGRILAQGTPQEVRENPDVIAAYLGSHAKELAHAEG
ncbi:MULTISPECIES: ABC transporter ATP-binding protein [Variovorax]|jgi:branched-chain amino acid transport system ATP-binding protein|uniref:ABC transporter ATP-binding protein n=1 Tax=Variovorax TaxID=34072 RepID=UPI001219E881|nr:ABC transporter ATP-binding protein [Variovorax sp.]TAJ60449.1 MAG: ABC transporter ATP-binding protein [Variovorax sp.]